ncbi:Ca2+-binding protein, partial [Commensalibacter communis]|uniref:calcium-binding protein n=1 Tax=Commensalibacter communis TaxID=2972786 RepID=UPI0022FFC147
YGGAGNDVINGGAGNDSLYGGSGNDTLIGGTGNDYLSGDEGSDTYVLSKGDGNDTIYNHITNSTDKDVVQFKDISSKDVTGASIEGNDLIIQYGENDSVRLQYYFDPSNSFRVQEYQFTDQTLNNDQLMALLPINVKTGHAAYQFGNGGNQINGDASNNSFYSGNGNDIVQTGDGNNYVDAQDGDDHVYGGSGNDTIYGGTGSDVIDGGAGNDILDGGVGNDTILGGTGNDTIYGGAGDDLLYGGANNDNLYGGAGNDTLIGGTGDDYLSGGEGSNTYVFSTDSGNDTIYNRVVNPEDKSVVHFTDISSKDVSNAYAQGNDLVIQYGKNDSIRLQNYFDQSYNFRVQEYQFTDQTLNNDQLMALLPIDVKTGDTSYQFGNGGNQINGDASNNNFFTGNGNDIIQAGDGNNYVDAQDGDDQIYSGSGNDSLYGGAGNDIIDGGAGNDSLYGGTGNDTLIGGAGDDYLSGDEGSDTYVLSKGAGNDTIYNHVTNSTDKSVIQFTDISSKDVTGASIEGNDLIIQYGENDSVRLQYYFDPSNNFRVQEYQFTDQTLNNDQLMALLPIDVKSSDTSYQFGNGGNQINGDASNNSFFTGNGNDVIQTGDGNNYVNAQDGDDQITGGIGNDTIYGGAGNDVINGGAGNDTLYGGTGNDTLIGGAGDDYLSGDEGSDTYVLSKGDGHDTIYNHVTNPADKSVVQFTDI